MKNRHVALLMMSNSPMTNLMRMINRTNRTTVDSRLVEVVGGRNRVAVQMGGVAPMEHDQMVAVPKRKTTMMNVLDDAAGVVEVADEAEIAIGIEMTTESKLLVPKSAAMTMANAKHVVDGHVPRLVKKVMAMDAEDADVRGVDVTGTKSEMMRKLSTK